MGGTAVRAHTLGVSFGNALSVEPSLDVFNEKAYAAIDFAVVAAKLYGIKVSAVMPIIDSSSKADRITTQLLIPLVDNVGISSYEMASNSNIGSLFSTTTITGESTSLSSGTGSTLLALVRISYLPTLAPTSTIRPRL